MTKIDEHKVTSRADGFGNRDCSCGGLWNDRDEFCSTLKEAAKASQQPEQEPFEVFMLAVHKHGTSGLGYRKALAEYEAAKKKPDVEALIAKLDDYFLLDKRERISAAFALTVFDIIRKWAKGQA